MSGLGQQPVLVINAGSSSLKAGLFVQAKPGQAGSVAGELDLLAAEVSGIGTPDGKLKLTDGSGKELKQEQHAAASQQEALTRVVEVLQTQSSGLAPAAIGHRVVHGGPRLREHTCLNAGVVETLRQAIHFAPLHLPGSLKLIEQAGKLFPGISQVACFDTVFHNTMPPVARRLPIPRRFAEQGVERYGFHGLSYESLVRQLEAEPEPLPQRIVFAHLGGGSSLCAVHRGRSIDTTMGLTPTGGVPMATRTGDLDPGVLLFLARRGHPDTNALEQLVNHDAGLAAIGGGSGDMQALEQAISGAAGPAGSTEAATQADAALAFHIFTTAVAKQIAALTVSLEGLDLLVFAGGIGEHSAAVRAEVVSRLAAFGFRLDAAANKDQKMRLHAENSKVAIRILAAQEDAVIAAHTRRLTSAR